MRMSPFQWDWLYNEKWKTGYWYDSSDDDTDNDHDAVDDSDNDEDTDDEILNCIDKYDSGDAADDYYNCGGSDQTFDRVECMVKKKHMCLNSHACIIRRTSQRVGSMVSVPPWQQLVTFLQHWRIGNVI